MAKTSEISFKRQSENMPSALPGMGGMDEHPEFWLHGNQVDALLEALGDKKPVVGQAYYGIPMDLKITAHNDDPKSVTVKVLGCSKADMEEVDESEMKPRKSKLPSTGY